MLNSQCVIVCVFCVSVYHQRHGWWWVAGFNAENLKDLIVEPKPKFLVAVKYLMFWHVLNEGALTQHLTLKQTNKSLTLCFDDAICREIPSQTCVCLCWSVCAFVQQFRLLLNSCVSLIVEQTFLAQSHV